MQWKECKQCEKGEAERARILLALFVIATIILLAVVLHRFPEETFHFLQRRNMPFKILIGFVQVAGSIPQNFRLIFPPLVVEFFEFMQYINIFGRYPYFA